MSEKANPFAKFLSHHSKGDYIFREGDEGDEMYIIQTGRVSIQKVIRGKKTPLTVLEKGDFFGEMSVLERLPRTADAEAIEDADLISINSATFGEMIRSNPEIAVRMLRKYSMRMREFAEQLEVMMVSRDGGKVSWPREKAFPNPRRLPRPPRRPRERPPVPISLRRTAARCTTSTRTRSCSAAMIPLLATVRKSI